MLRVLCFASLFIFSSAQAGDALSFPQFGNLPSGFRVEVLQSGKACHDAFYRLERVREVISSANEHFKGRKWSEEFLAERFKVAEKYDGRSEYYSVRNEKTGQLVATLGATFAEYRERDLQNPGGLDLIPVEDTLKLPLLPRPVSTDGRGIILELRSYSIDHEFHRDVYAPLIERMLAWVFLRVGRDSHLYDKPIIYTYADETSLRLYGMMGFERLSEEPVVHAGSNWWPMATSLKVLENLANRGPRPELMIGFNQPMSVRLNNGRKVKIGIGGAYLGRMKVPSGNGLSAEGVRGFIGVTEVEPGIYAAGGSTVMWLDGKINSVSDLAKPIIQDSVKVSIGSKVTWSSRGTILEASKIGERLDFGSGIIAAKGAAIARAESGSPLFISQLERAAEVAPGVVASSGATVRWDESGIILISALEQRANLGQGIIAARGAKVEWTYDTASKIRKLREVSILDSDAEIAPGLWAARGAYFLRVGGETSAPVVSKLARPVKVKGQIFDAGSFFPAKFQLDQISPVNP